MRVDHHIMPSPLDRRTVLRGGVAAGSALVLPRGARAQETARAAVFFASP